MAIEHVDVTRYMSIPYLHRGRDRNGVDCYGLVLLFYSENFGVTCPDYTYVKGWDEKGFDYIEDEYWRRFERIDSPVKYGLVTFRGFGSTIERHIGIMIDDISFLHAPLNSMVSIDKLTNRVWSRQLGSFYRIKEGGNG